METIRPESIDIVDPVVERYGGVIHKLKILDYKHLSLQRLLHSGEISDHVFSIRYFGIQRERERQVLAAARIAIVSEDSVATSAAHIVINSHVNEGKARFGSQVSFLRRSGISNYLQHFK